MRTHVEGLRRRIAGEAGFSKCMPAPKG